MNADQEQPETSPYGPRPSTAAMPSAGLRKVRIHHLRQLKDRGEKWAMLTAYDQFSAQIFDEAGIPVLLVGDSAANNVLGYATTLPVTVDEMLPLVRAVARAATHSLIVADLPFGSYQSSPEQALATSIRMMKEGLAHAVKFEGGRRVASAIELITGAGIPVMAHLGFTPQSEHALSGYRVQGRGDEGAHRLIQDAKAMQQAGAFAVVMEVVPADVAAKITRQLTIPTIGIGAGPSCDAQVLVWQDMAGLRTGGKSAKFVKAFAEVGDVLQDAATRYADEVRNGSYPAEEHTYR